MLTRSRKATAVDTASNSSPGKPSSALSNASDPPPQFMSTPVKSSSTHQIPSFLPQSTSFKLTTTTSPNMTNPVASRFQPSSSSSQKRGTLTSAPATSTNQNSVKSGANFSHPTTLDQHAHTASGHPQNRSKSTPPTPSSSSTTPSSSSFASNSSSVSVSSRTILSRRIRWNSTALAIVWFLPIVTSRPRDLYWSCLDVIHSTFGGSIDETVDGIVGWLFWAISLVLAFNLLESLLLQRRKPVESNSSTSSNAGSPSKPVPPHMTLSTLRGSPKTRPSLGPDSPLSSSRQTRRQPISSSSPSSSSPLTTPSKTKLPLQNYSVFSPNSTTTSSVIGSPSPLKRVPEYYSPSYSPTGSNNKSHPATPENDRSNRSVSSPLASGSPLAAYRARFPRHSSSALRRVHPPSLSSPSSSSSVSVVSLSHNGSFSLNLDDDDYSDDENENDIGNESWEVEKALRSIQQFPLSN